uniref:Uncharacterized protein n=1 Tax=Ditylenchus dipsaci TaxID=166011 RepID=A0A915D6J9_9BILA
MHVGSIHSSRPGPLVPPHILVTHRLAIWSKDFCPWTLANPQQYMVYMPQLQLDMPLVPSTPTAQPFCCWRCKEFCWVEWIDYVKLHI